MGSNGHFQLKETQPFSFAFQLIYFRDHFFVFPKTRRRNRRGRASHARMCPFRGWPWLWVRGEGKLPEIFSDMYQRVSNFIVEIKHNKSYKTYKNMILFLTRIDDEDSSQDPTRFWITESEGRVCNPCPVYWNHQKNWGNNIVTFWWYNLTG